jgi:hypothetical protein
MRPSAVYLLLAPWPAVGVATAQQPSIPLRMVGPASARTVEPLGALLGVIELSNGKVLVNDAGRRRLMMFDTTLTGYSTIADTAGAATHYGAGAAPLIPYLGDSALFVDAGAQSLLIIDPSGKIVRVAAAPNASDIRFIATSRTGVDLHGRLIYRSAFPPVPPPAKRQVGTTVTHSPDSAPLIRADFETRTVDTIALLRMPVVQELHTTVRDDGTTTYKSVRLPVTSIDDWTTLGDGTVAIVRAQDYHIDWIGSDGAKTSTSRMPFAWLRITDEVKQHMADSVRDVEQGRLVELRKLSPPAPSGTSRIGGSISLSDGSRTFTPTSADAVSASLDKIPDYYPPIRAGAVKADVEGNVWILPATAARSTGGGLTYDLVNRQGQLFERVQLPPDRSIAGFGRGGVIYMMWRDSSAAWHLERSRVKR